MPRQTHIASLKNKPPALRVPQVRVLRALLPGNPNDPPSEWPLLTRSALAMRAGYSPISGSITRVLHGIHAGSSSGDPYLGIIALKLCEVISVDIDGIREDNYRITREGIRALGQFIMDGGYLPPVRDAESHTNDRYKQEEEDS